MPSSYALGAHFEALMDDLIASGRYNSKSEILRDGLRIIEERESRRQLELDALRKAIQDGIDSGPGLPADEVFGRLKAKYKAMADARKKSA
ncbi:MAG: type II toxin-antitoxin system ParD family antitoxin [Asticcacaulis sp.]|uniref:type II toxin-antitoxin system ParD family antitoxin n=1 Tax=Asticcacaulis sp. TaxID=1872648 RepID=UPI003F7C4E36